MNKKEAVFNAFRELLAQDVANTDKFRAVAQFDANEAEGRMISRYDTFKEEAQFLAVGQEIRKLERESTLAMLDKIQADCVRACSKVFSGAMIEVEDDDGNVVRYYMIPGGSGKVITIEGASYICISPESPLGRALIGKTIGDEAIMSIDKTRKSVTIVGLE